MTEHICILVSIVEKSQKNAMQNSDRVQLIIFLLYKSYHKSCHIIHIVINYVI